MGKKYPVELDILVIEDEKYISAFYQKELQRYGHSVMVANDFHQACNILRSGQKFHLVVTDMTMQSLPFTEVIGSIAGLVEAYQQGAKVLILSARPIGQMEMYVNLFSLAGFIDRSMSFEGDIQEILSKIETLFPTN